MDAVEFLKTKKRMCEGYDACYGCCFFNIDDEEKSCENFAGNFPEKAVALIEQWGKENPVKTYKDILLEKFPNASIKNICIECIFGDMERDCKDYDSCKDCWGEEYKEEQK